MRNHMLFKVVCTLFIVGTVITLSVSHAYAWPGDRSTTVEAKATLGRNTVFGITCGQGTLVINRKTYSASSTTRNWPWNNTCTYIFRNIPTNTTGNITLNATHVTDKLTACRNNVQIKAALVGNTWSVGTLTLRSRC